MPVTPGTRLGPYEILAPLGAGGMGEVYRARDTRLERTVAIKVLPASLASDPQFRERFNREARTISQLDHPHICALHDAGEHDGTPYLVMQYLEGETLASALERAAARDRTGLRLEDALTIAIQIASALDAAHRAGIVHRDLKPANVMITSVGAKLLDFGLAKSHSDSFASAGASSLATMPPGLTAEGTILGTLQYMAPEQLEGGAVDPRTDIFAFGALLHEMCTGRKAFEGNSRAGLVAAILEHDPAAVSSVAQAAPDPLDRLVKTCLAKDPDDRWQTARDLLRELEWIADGGASAHRPTAVGGSSARARRPMSVRLVWGSAIAGLIVAMAAVGLMRWNRTAVPAPSSPALARLSVALPDGVRLVNSYFPMLALSPRGTHLVYVAGASGKSQLYLRQIDTFETKAIPGTDGATSPFFSPDGQWVAFASAGKLRKVSIAGGSPAVLADTQNLFGGTWGANDTIVFAANDVGLSQVSSNGGPVTAATLLDAGANEGGHLYPEFLPDGKSMLLTIGTTGTNMEKARIVLHSMEDGHRRVLIQGGTHARYVASGHLVYNTAGTLMAAPFDLNTKTVTGPAVPMIDGITQSEIGAAQFSVSATGSLAYVPGGVRTPQRKLLWMDRRGVAMPLPLPSRPYLGPQLSPDGRHIAVGIEGTTHDVWVSNVDRDSLTRLTFGSDNYWPFWTPDGTRIVFQSNRAGSWNLFWAPVDRSAPEEQLVRSNHAIVQGSWSPDGQMLVFTEVDPDTSADLWILPLAPPRTPRPFLRTPAFEFGGAIAPDGRWIAYQSNETGREEIYVQRFPEGGQKQQVTTEGGYSPMWDKNGHELFYATPRGVMSITIGTRTGLTVAKPRLLIEVALLPSPYTSYDAAPGGQRFVIVKEDAGEPGPATINIVQGWLDELKRRAPAK